ncbi:saposin domain-containing protein [Fundidesulfovibrio putealis]|uniref:saposin domain-containing protein n=1 Tax=Fundidesulfovibrio putealis TaxID=270496 RepID=UPI000410B0B1|nr:saposin domain-containing protein [Fundidesulfovibrio putealis]
MTRLIFAAIAALALFVSAGAPVAQSASYMECAACQLVLGLVESSAGEGDVVVDASKQCSLLPAADREACVKFYAAMGPKFIKALKDKRAKGENLESVCRSMDYCQ